jgi:hypothetical protein
LALEDRRLGCGTGRLGCGTGRHENLLSYTVSLRSRFSLPTHATPMHYTGFGTLRWRRCLPCSAFLADPL